MIANLPEANPTDRIDANEYPNSARVNNSPSLVSNPKKLMQ